MSYASDLKNELALSNSKYIKDELSSLLKTNGNITIKNKKWTLTFKIENAKVATKVFKEISALYDVKPITSIYKSMKLKKSTIYYLSIEDKVSTIISDLSLMDNDNIKQIVRSDYRMKAFLKGAFMASGSVNNPSSTNYHLEISFIDEEFASEICKIMNKLNLNAKIIKRRNQSVVYLKRAQEIADFIAYIGANNSYLDFEDERINRDFRNSDNRLYNCDIANAVRTNIASLNQIEMINAIKNTVGLDYLDKNLVSLCNLRLDNPEDSLVMLANKYNELNGTNYTKSGINHLFEKIKEIAKELSLG